MPIIILDEGPGSAASPAPRLTIEQPVIDLQYFKTPQGLVKVAQIIFGIVLIAINPPIWLMIIAWLALFGTFPWFWIYFFSINKKYSVNPPWVVLEFYFTAAAFIAYAVMTFVTFITIVFLISAIFGFVLTCAYGAGAFFLFKDWKAWKEQSPTAVPK